MIIWSSLQDSSVTVVLLLLGLLYQTKHSIRKVPQIHRTLWWICWKVDSSLLALIFVLLRKNVGVFLVYIQQQQQQFYQVVCPNRLTHCHIFVTHHSSSSC